MAPTTPLLLSALLLLPSSYLSSFTAAKAPQKGPPPGPFCKTAPGDSSWPSTESWASLNESTGGRLLQPSPPGAVCHPGQPTFNAAECPTVNASWSTYEFHQANPISVDWNEWVNDTCLPWKGYPCSSEGYPVFVVNASTASHVKAGIDFAREHNIRLVVKSSGHDYIGRSAAPYSLSIWVHHIKPEMHFHSSFSPKNCIIRINSTAVTVGGGTQMEEIYSTLDAINQTTVGGGGKTVSVGGYLTGGGHGLLAPRHGLAADQVLEMEVVTPTGEIVTANECTNEDLFWAMRGGGGSTFGILTAVTVKTFPTPSIVQRVTGIYTTNATAQAATFDMIAYVISQFPALGDQGLSGYSEYSLVYPNPFDNGTTTVAGILLSMALQDSNDTAMDALWAPIVQHITATWPGLFQVVQVPAIYPSFYAWYQKNFDSSAAGYDMAPGSRLLGKEVLTANLTRSAETFARVAGGSGGTAYLVSGKGVHNAQPRGGGNAVCPAWRNAYVHATLGARWPPLNATARAAALADLNARTEPLRQLAPDSGAYMNEADPYEPDWQHTFWGVNYEKLVHIKHAVDPEDVLWCTPCVGNERWEQVDGRLCRVKNS